MCCSKSGFRSILVVIYAAYANIIGYHMFTPVVFMAPIDLNAAAEQRKLPTQSIVFTRIEIFRESQRIKRP